MGVTVRMKSSSLVHLNVGGVKFVTTMSTIDAFGEDSLLSRMCRTEVATARDKDGDIFVDRDPKMFELVLDVLRNGKRPRRSVIDRFVWTKLEDELRYFCISISDLPNDVNDSNVRLALEDAREDVGQRWRRTYRVETEMILSMTLQSIMERAVKGQLANHSFSSVWFMSDVALDDSNSCFPRQLTQHEWKCTESFEIFESMFGRLIGNGHAKIKKIRVQEQQLFGLLSWIPRFAKSENDLSIALVNPGFEETQRCDWPKHPKSRYETLSDRDVGKILQFFQESIWGFQWTGLANE